MYVFISLVRPLCMPGVLSFRMYVFPPFVISFFLHVFRYFFRSSFLYYVNYILRYLLCLRYLLWGSLFI